MLRGLFILIFILMSTASLVSAIRINEVMAHTNNSFGDEWIELYNNGDNDLSLNGWIIGDLVGNDTINLTIKTGKYALIVDSNIEFEGDKGCKAIDEEIGCYELESIGKGLNDNSETVFLYDNDFNLIYSFNWSENLKTEGESWSFTNKGWIKCEPTPGLNNSCLDEEDEIEEDETQNITEEADKIFLRLDYKSDIRNGEEFEVEIESYNLESYNYDVKVYITFKDNGTIISEVYDKEEGVWKSGNYYLESLIRGKGNKTEVVKLIISKSYEDFVGEAKINAKIRKSGNSLAEAEFWNNLSVLKRKVAEEDTEEKNNTKENNTEEILIADNTVKKNETGVIYLNPEKTKSINSEVLFLSLNEKIKIISIYGFALLCVFVVVLLIRKKL